MFELNLNAEVLFEIYGEKIINYNLEPFKNGDYKGFYVEYVGSIGIGSFTYQIDDKGNEFLDTELMGKEWCLEFMKQIFNCCDVDYEENQNK